MFCSPKSLVISSSLLASSAVISGLVMIFFPVDIREVIISSYEYIRGVWVIGLNGCL